MKIDQVQHTIEFGTRKICYRLHLSDRKNLRVVVTPELMVDIFAPETATDQELNSAIKKKAPWIAKTLDKLEGYHPLPVPQQYVSGETLVYLGRQYRLKVEYGVSQPAKLIGRFLWVWVIDKTDTQNIKKSIEAWYRKRAHDVLARYTKSCYQVASRHGVPEPGMTIRHMRRRWGSCSPSGRITLNLDLIKVPVHCIEYVITHELCHLKHHNHAKSFYSLLTRCLPNWRQRKELLDKFRLS